MRDPELLRAPGAGLFIAEGRLIVRRLLEQDRFRVRSVLVTPAALSALHDWLVDAAADVLVADQDVMNAITGFHLHRGCLALAERGAGATLDELSVSGGPLVMLENVGNPDNVGGAFRNAAAFGASGIVLSPGCSDPLYRKAIRTSMGAALSVPFTIAAAWPGAIDRLRHQGWFVVGLTPAGEIDIRAAARRASGSRVALMAGHEGDGLTADALARATVRARIPIAASVDSLNVASAVGVALYAWRAG